MLKWVVFAFSWWLLVTSCALNHKRNQVNTQPDNTSGIGLRKTGSICFLLMHMSALEGKESISLDSVVCVQGRLPVRTSDYVIEESYLRLVFSDESNVAVDTFHLDHPLLPFYESSDPKGRLIPHSPELNHAELSLRLKSNPSYHHLSIYSKRKEAPLKMLLSKKL